MAALYLSLPGAPREVAGEGAEAKTPGAAKERAAGNRCPPPPHTLNRLPVSDYLLQQPEPQQSACSPVALTVGHSSTQHSHRHAAHLQVPVSQHPQQSQMGQPNFWLPSIVAMKGTRPSVAQRKKLFMGKPSLHDETESITPRHNV